MKEKRLKRSEKRKHSNMVVAVDLDGTIIKDWSGSIFEFGELQKGAVDYMKKIRKAGYTIMIHTCRLTPSVYKYANDTQELALVRIEKFLDDNDIPYDAFWVGEGKPVADFYIDDRGIRFETWKQVWREMNERM